MQIPESLFKRPSRYSAKTHSKPVNFYCSATEASQVCLAGDFNHWNPHSHPMHKQLDGTWSIQVHLPHGHQHYWFVIDGQPALDPRAQGIGRNAHNQRVSLIAIS